MVGKTDSGLTARLKRIGARVIAVAITRLELASEEMRVFARDVLRALFFHIACLALGILGLISAVIAITLSVPEADRPFTLALCAAGLLAAALLAGYRAERIHQHPALSASIAELRADSAELSEAGGPARSSPLSDRQTEVGDRSRAS